MPDPLIPLNYGKAPRPKRRWLWLVLLFLVIAIVVVGWRKGWGDAAKRMWDLYQLNAPVRRAMKYTFPQGKVLWDPAASPPINVPSPAEWRSTFIGSAPWSGDTPLFMHGRTTQSGVQRLVVINFVQPRSGHGQHLSTLLMAPGTLTTYPRHHGPDMGLDLQTLPAMPVRFYAGQPDPANDSHFTIDFDAPGGRYTIDGWLKDTTSPPWDPVQVKMEVRPANAK